MLGSRQLAFSDAHPIKCILDLARLQFDLIWASSELMTSLFSCVALSALVRRGDGNRPVLTLPGFTGPEFSLAPLNAFLDRCGYVATGWGQGVNIGPNGHDYYDRLSQNLHRRLEEMANIHDRPVSLIGQSLGGVYAREVARDHPDLVDRVITLGTPAYLSKRSAEHLNRMIGHTLNVVTGSEPHAPASKRNHAAPPPVPLVSIFSRYDGVVSQCSTRIPEADLISTEGTPRENIEVCSSHCGMAVGPLALLAITDRLQADPSDWEPFEPHRYFPSASHWAVPYWYPR